jgi:exosortase
MTGSLCTKSRKGIACCAAILVVFLVWVYWPRLVIMANRWSQDPQYTHAYVVPLFAAVVLWFRRDCFPLDQVAPSWWGVALLVLAAVLRLMGAVFSFDWLEAGSLIPALAGVVLLTAGPAVLRWSLPGGVFLLFILPWPYQFDILLTFPLRRIATICSTFALQTLGIPALARGNIIVINDLEIGVVEACSGLGMLMTFFALSTAVAFVIQRPLFDKVVIFLSAIPIGVLMNVVRITITVLLYQVASEDVAKVVFHDVAGWVMMPLALVVLWLEMLWLSRLWLPVERTGPLPVPIFPEHVGAVARPQPLPVSAFAESLPRPEEVGHPLQEIRDAAL